MMEYHYVECGLDHIFLRNGFKVEDGPYGATVSFRALDSLHHAISFVICTSPYRLQGQHVRFFRSRLGLSQKEIADSLDVRRGTVARWEAEKSASIPGPADRALRVLALGQDCPDFPAGALAGIFRDIGEVGAPRLVMEYRSEVGEEDLFQSEAPADTEEEWRATAA